MLKGRIINVKFILTFELNNIYLLLRVFCKLILMLNLQVIIINFTISF
jgi:hypothetical protein